MADNNLKVLTAGLNTEKSLIEINKTIKALISSMPNFRAEAAKLIQEINNVGTAANHTKDRIFDFDKAVRSTFSKLPEVLISTAVAASLNFIKEGIAYVNELNKSLTDLSIVYMKSQSEVEEYGRKFHDMGMEMGVLTQELATGAVEFARQGLSETEMLSSMQTAVQYAKISNIDYATSARILTASVNSMGVEAARAADVFSYMGDSTASSASEIGEALINIGGAAGNVGLSFEKVSSWIATLSSRTRESAQSIGNSIKSIITRMQSLQDKGSVREDGTQVNQVSQALEEVGVQLFDNQGSFRDFGIVMDDLGAKWESLSANQKSYISTLMAGSAQQNQFLNLMDGYSDSIHLYEGSLNSAGIAQRKFELYQEGTEAKLNQLKNAWTGVYQSAFDSEGIRSFIEILTSLATGLDNMIKQFGSIPTALGIAGAAFVLFSNKARASIISLSGVLTTNNVTFLNVSAATNIWATSMGLSSVAARGLSVAVGGLTVAVRSLLISTGVGAALVALGYVIEAVIGSTSTAEDNTKSLSDSYKETVSSINDQTSALTNLSSEYENLKSKTSLTLEETQRLQAIERDLVATYGVAASGINLQGEAIADNTLLIKQRIEELKNQKKTEDEMLKNKVLGNFDNQEKVSSAIKNIDSNSKKIEDEKTHIKILEEAIANNSDAVLPNGNVIKDQDYMETSIKRRRTYLSDLTNQLESNKADLQKYSADINQVLLNEINNNAIDISAKSREVAVQFAKALSLSDIDPSKSVENMNKFLNTLKMDDGLDQLLTKYDELKSKLKDSPLDSSLAGEVENTANKIKGHINQIYNTQGLSKEATDGINVFKQNLFNLLSVMENGNSTKLEFITNQEGLTKAYKDATNELDYLQQISDDINHGRTLSIDSVTDLILRYPLLASAVKKTANGYTIEKKALDDLREAQKKNAEAKIKAEIGMTDVAIAQLSSRLTAYGIELNMIDTMEKADSTINEKRKMLRNNKVLGDDNDQYTKDFISMEDAIYKFALLQEQLRILQEGLSNPGKSNTSNIDKDLPKQVDLINERIKSFNKEYKSRQENNKALEEQIEKYEKQKDYNKSIELTNQLLKEQHATITDLNTANDKIHNEANNLRDQYPKYDTEPWFDKYGDATETYKNFLGSLPTGKAQEEAEKLFNKIQQLKKAWRDNADTIKDLRTASEETFTKIGEQIYNKVTIEIEKSSNAVKAFDDQLSISKDRISLLKEGTQEYVEELQNQSEILQNKMKAEEENEKNIKRQMQTVGLSNEKWTELNGKLKESVLAQMGIATAMRSTNQELINQVDQLGNEIVAIYKEMYGKQKEAAQEAHKEKIKLLDEELKKYEDLIQTKLKALDEEFDKEDDDKRLGKMQNERDEIQNQINEKAMDDSIETKAKLEELQQELADKNQEIADFHEEQTREARKKNLEDMLEKEKNKTEKEKDELNKRQEEQDIYYDELINNERKYEQIRKDVSNGVTAQITSDLSGFKDFAINSYGLIGISVSENLQDRITKAEENMRNIITPGVITSISAIGESLDTEILKVLDSIIAKFNELNTIQQMKANSIEWANTTNKSTRDSLYKENQSLGKEIGADYDSKSGTWSKGGIRLYHSGGIVGDKGTPLIERLHRILNLGSDERPAILKTGELVVRNNPIANLINTITPPIFSAYNKNNNQQNPISLSFGKLIHIDKIEKDVDVDRLMNKIDTRFKSFGFVQG